MPEMKNNILDYLDWRGDLSFSAAPFCEVDNLIFCMLSFADFSPAVSADPTGVPVKLSDVREAVREKYPSGEDFGEVVPKFVNELVDKALKSPRFREVYAAGFQSVLEESEITQFAAVTFVLPDNSLFVAYRGTDDTLVGWREDFCLSFTKPVRAQQLAAEYLADMASVYSGPVRVGGHSKGGNLAHYAAAFAPKHIRSRILTAYSNDGPGFLREIAESPEFREAESAGRFVTLVPQSSVVGMLLGHNETYQVVESSAGDGIWQHDPFTWTVKGPEFVHLDSLSAVGRRHDEAFAEWLEGISPEKRSQFTDTVFGLLGSTGAKTISDLTKDLIGTLAAMARTYAGLDRDARDNLILFLRKLAEASWKAGKES